MHSLFLAVAAVLPLAVRASPLVLTSTSTAGYFQISCNHDNLYRSLADTRYTAAASEFCSTYVTPAITSTTTVTPFQTITTLVPSTTIVTSASTATSVISPVVTSTAVLSTETITSTTSTQTITITASTETDVSILGTSYATVTLQTNDVTDILATDTEYSTSTTILSTIVSGTDVISLATITSTDIVATYTAPEIAQRAATTLPIGSSLVSSYGATRVSSACSCILTSAASVQTVLITVSAPRQTLTQTSYTVATSVVSSAATITQTSVVTTVINVVASTTIYATASQTSSITTTLVDYTTISSEIDATATSTLFSTYTTTLGAAATSDIAVPSTITDAFEATITLPTTLQTILSVTTTTTPAGVPTGFALHVSAPGTTVDGYYIQATINGGAPYLTYVPALSSASTFILTTQTNYNKQITYTGVPQFITPGFQYSNWIMTGFDNLPIEAVAIEPTTNLGVGMSTSTHNPLQCAFAGPGKYTGTFTCSVATEIPGRPNTFFELYLASPMDVIMSYTVASTYTQIYLTGVPLF